MIATSTVRKACAPLACLVALLALAGGAPQAQAQSGACTQSCQTAYAKCYKDSGSNRRICEAQLQQCLAGCISKRQN